MSLITGPNNRSHEKEIEHVTNMAEMVPVYPDAV